MKVAISGGTGLIGKKLVEKLLHEGHEVTVLTRNPRVSKEEGLRFIAWPADADGRKYITTADVVFNLAGEPVAQRWTEKAKEKILSSRLDTTDALVEIIDPQRTALISASAIGLYPEGDNFSTEDTSPDEGFLSHVVQAWENSALEHASQGGRVVCVRIGLVLSEDGGALAKLLPIFKLGLGSPVGTGKHWQSWIHIDDLVNLFYFAATNSTMRGCYNGVSPHPVDNRTLSASMAKALKRPFFFPPVPGFVLRLMFGKMSSVILSSQRVSSKRVETVGFKFRFPHVQEAMNDLFR